MVSSLSKQSEEANLFFGQGTCTKTIEKRIVDISKSSAALDSMIQSLPRSMGALQDIHHIVRCAMAKTPAERALGVIYKEY